MLDFEVRFVRFQGYIFRILELNLLDFKGRFVGF